MPLAAPQHLQRRPLPSRVAHASSGKGPGAQSKKGGRVKSRFGPGGSQGGQTARLARIFATIGTTNKRYVEFGYQGRSTSNTFQLRQRDGWSGLLLDGDSRWTAKPDGEPNLHLARITSRNVVKIFRKHSVPAEADYVSIDIDSHDLWVLRALLSSEYRPRVLTVEYNSNFPWGTDLAFPDPEVMPITQKRFAMWGGNCYMGSSASALHAVAREYKYSVVDVVRRAAPRLPAALHACGVPALHPAGRRPRSWPPVLPPSGAAARRQEPGLDLFLVRDDVWAGRPVPDLSLHAALYRPFNVQLDGPMSPLQKAQYVDYAVYRRTGGNVSRARAAAADAMRALAARGVPCAVGHRKGCLLQKCDTIYSFLCVERDDPRPCERYQPNPGAWLVPQGCLRWPCNDTARYGVAARCAGKKPKQCPLLQDPDLLP